MRFQAMILIGSNKGYFKNCHRFQRVLLMGAKRKSKYESSASDTSPSGFGSASLKSGTEYIPSKGVISVLTMLKYMIIDWLEEEMGSKFLR
mmetsp:Transcript_9729/g.18802  ORF Transcript_9729/g.18802 Transcript_9729/m.18802 type:complete len:91 (-) Transcript_9729:185-457(-)